MSNTQVIIKDTDKIEELKASVLQFKEVAADTVSIVGEYVMNAFADFEESKSILKNIYEEAQQAYQNAKDSYDAAWSDYQACKSNVYTDYDDEGNSYTVYPDCSCERHSMEAARDEMHIAKDKMDKAKRNYDKCCGLIESLRNYERGFRVKSQAFEPFASRHSEDTTRDLQRVIDFVMEYNAIPLPVFGRSSGNWGGNGSTGDGSTTVGSPLSLLQNNSNKNILNEFSVGDFLGYGGERFEIKCNTKKDLNNNFHEYYDVYGADGTNKAWGGFKKIQGEKTAYLTDFEVPDYFDRSKIFGSTGGSVLYELEKVAKKSGCNEIRSWVTEYDVGFYKSCNYTIVDEDAFNNGIRKGGGFEVFKKI